MTAHSRVLAGDCTVTFSGDRERTSRGYVVVLTKPDRTVLVHDSQGYQPVAWLTRADEVTVETEGDAFALSARRGERRLRVVSHAPTGRREFPVTAAGRPVGECPDCGGTLVRDGGVSCLGCGGSYGIPDDASVLDAACPECGLPRIRVRRGDVFEVCLDPACESLHDAVAEALDGRWTCPDCGCDLRANRARGRVFLGCGDYPDCETTFSLPAGVAVDDCACGLPVFETKTGRRCLDPTCTADATGADREGAA